MEKIHWMVIVVISIITIVGWTFAISFRHLLLDKQKKASNWQRDLNRIEKENYCLRLGVEFLTNIPGNKGTTRNPIVYEKGGRVKIPGIYGQELIWGDDSKVYFDGIGLVIKPQNPNQNGLFK